MHPDPLPAPGPVAESPPVFEPTAWPAAAAAPAPASHAQAPADVPALQAALAAASAERDALRAAHEAFLRSVSHDLRAPLRHVTSYGGLVRELLHELPTPRPAQVDEALGFVGTMEQSSRRMAAMLDALLALSRASSAPLQPQAVRLDDVLREAQAQCMPRSAGRQVQWEWDAALPALPPLAADGAALRDLLVHLLDNALKFTAPRAVARIRVQALPAAPGQVAWQVLDNGVGFDPARAVGLGGVFQRLHRESEFPGLGCGLALCHAVARRHGAHLAVTAAAGQGCAARVDWPAATV